MLYLAVGQRQAARWEVSFRLSLGVVAHSGLARPAGFRRRARDGWSRARCSTRDLQSRGGRELQKRDLFIKMVQMCTVDDQNGFLDCSWTVKFAPLYRHIMCVQHGLGPALQVGSCMLSRPDATQAVPSDGIRSLAQLPQDQWTQGSHEGIIDRMHDHLFRSMDPAALNISVAMPFAEDSASRSSICNLGVDASCHDNNLDCTVPIPEHMQCWSETAGLGRLVAEGHKTHSQELTWA